MTWKILKSSLNHRVYLQRNSIQMVRVSICIQTVAYNIVYVTVEKVTEERLSQLPLSRIKSIMKLDPELNLVSSDSVFLMSKVTELFIKSLARESFAFVEQGKKKTVQKKDVDSAINAVDALMFLEGALDFN